MKKENKDKLFIDSLLSQIKDLKYENLKLKEELEYIYKRKLSVRLKNRIKKVLGM